jgi:hypothetical protein
MKVRWTTKGVLLGACNCDWGCPCSFNARPTKGFCEGCYVWRIESGQFGELRLDGLTMALAGHSPGAVHEGNLTTLIVMDERATPPQRDALSKLSQGKMGGPWAIFAAVTSKWLEPRFARFEFDGSGLNSRVRAAEVLELALGPILNPVSNEPEEIYLDKPTGFTAKRTELGRSLNFRVRAELNYDHSGQFGEFSHFEYSGEGDA